MIKVAEIKKFAGNIAEHFHPERIILFGSYATGKPDEFSDVDLLVVMPFKGRSARVACEIISKTLPKFPVDIIVRTPKELAKRLSLNDYFLNDITKNGKVMYETVSS